MKINTDNKKPWPSGTPMKMKFSKTALVKYLKEEFTFNRDHAEEDMGMCYTDSDKENYLRSKASYEAKAEMIKEILEKFEL